MLLTLIVAHRCCYLPLYYTHVMDSIVIVSRFWTWRH